MGLVWFGVKYTARCASESVCSLGLGEFIRRECVLGFPFCV